MKKKKLYQHNHNYYKNNNKNRYKKILKKKIEKILINLNQIKTFKIIWESK